MVALILKKHLSLRFIMRMIRWHVRYYLAGRGSPVSAGVYLTTACNCRCIMCDIWREKAPQTYPLQAQKQALDALAKAGCYYYSVSGGEPTLVPDLCERLAYAAARIPYVHVVTNGLTMTAGLARDLANSGIREISISLDGSESIHNQLRGRPDAFAKAWQALELMRAHAPRVQVVVNSILSPYTVGGLKELNQLLRSQPGFCRKYLPLSFHQLFRTQGRTTLDSAMAPVSLEEMDAFIDMAQKDPRVVNSRIFLQKAKRYFKGIENVINDQKKCEYPYHAIEFDAQGRAYPCLTGCGAGNGIALGNDPVSSLKSPEYRRMQQSLESCDKCRGVMPLCYYEPRLNFPLHNLLKGRVSLSIKRAGPP